MIPLLREEAKKRRMPGLKNQEDTWSVPIGTNDKGDVRTLVCT